MLLVVQNDPEVPIGRFGTLLDQSGVAWQLLKAYSGETWPSLDKLAGVIVLGGAMGVNDLEKHPYLVEVKRFIAKVLQRRLAFLGICLGGQLLADVAGARVTSGQWGEKGALSVDLTLAGRDDRLFAGLGAMFTTFQWHSDSFAIPDKGVLLASSPVCPHQAFRCGTNAYGLQFHPEVDASIVACWSQDTPETALQTDRFVQEFLALESFYARVAEQLLNNFLHIVSTG